MISHDGSILRCTSMNHESLMSSGPSRGGKRESGPDGHYTADEPKEPVIVPNYRTLSLKGHRVIRPRLKSSLSSYSHLHVQKTTSPHMIVPLLNKKGIPFALDRLSRRVPAPRRIPDTSPLGTRTTLIAPFFLTERSPHLRTQTGISRVQDRFFCLCPSRPVERALVRSC